MTLRRCALLFALVLATADSAAGQWTAVTDSIRLGPGDMLRLEAYVTGLTSASAPFEGNGDYQVDADGSVLLPILGVARASNRPFGALRADVERAFTGQFRDVRIRVTPLVRIALLGEVRTPGLLPVDPTMDLADVVAAAGGLTPSADRADIRVVRGNEVIVVTGEGELPGVRMPLRSGDRVVVGRRSWLSENTPFVIGAAASVVAAVLTAVIVR